MWYDRVMISIHALLAESDKGVPRKEFVEQLFLSTLSLRRATCFSMLSRYRMQAFLSTLSLRRATDRGHKVCNVFAISIHALLAESDTAADISGEKYAQFLSTLSLRRATSAGLHRVSASAISIHALLAESDL